jgi:hypothetical protein
MRKMIAFASIATAVGPLLFTGQGLAQSKKQLDTCTNLYIPAQACHALARSEIDQLSDMSDIKTLSSALAPLVLDETIKQGLEKQASAAFQADMQKVSTIGNITQTGGTASTSGSTNLVAKPTTTDFLSLASESGAFTDTISGTTATIQANALGLFKYLNNVPVFAHWDARGADALQPLNFNVTLNIAQNGSTVAPTSGSATNTSLASLASIFVPSNNATLSSFGVTYAVYRRFNPQNQKEVKAWEDAVTANKLQSQTVAIGAAVGKLIPAGFADSPTTAAALSTWHSAATEAQQIADPDQKFTALAKAYSVYLRAYTKALLAQTDGLSKAVAFMAAVNTFEDGVYGLINKARGAPIATAGYTYTPSTQKPGTHSFTGSVAYSFLGDPKSTSLFHLSGAQLTGNFTAVLFASVPSGATYGRLQDYQASGEFDLPFGNKTGNNVLQPIGTFSVAGYGQYQDKPTVLNISAKNLLPGTNITIPSNAQAYLGTAGWLGVVQGKLVFNLKQGLSIPVAVKWSNKTDLLQANDVRGQVGISYDFSALSSLLKGSL